MTSPATSTPGSTPKRHKNGELIKSELQRSNESKIGNALISEEEDISPTVEKKVVKLKFSKRQRPLIED